MASGIILGKGGQRSNAFCLGADQCERPEVCPRAGGQVGRWAGVAHLC